MNSSQSIETPLLFIIDSKSPTMINKIVNKKIQSNKLVKPKETKTN